ncbi:MAG TPA: peptidylprolyl isomerase [Planctomycetes bacterium]|nr:peptidylprolyl isomerase [Planctomycetota bacterium]HIL37799.1 peptidylprolyl isomerase [Planctomycetota bacterium]
MKIEEGALVRLEYQVFDASGELFESSEEGGPVETVLGSGELPAGIENALTGLDVGAELNLTLAGDDAFGEVDPSRIETVPRAEFPEADNFTVGESVELVFEAEEGESDDEVPDEPITALIIEINPEAVVLDFNHPLAGQEVRVAVKVLACETT